MRYQKGDKKNEITFALYQVCKLIRSKYGDKKRDYEELGKNCNNFKLLFTCM